MHTQKHTKSSFESDFYYFYRKSIQITLCLFPLIGFLLYILNPIEILNNLQTLFYSFIVVILLYIPIIMLSLNLMEENE